MGVPVAPFSTKAFLTLAKTITRKKGMPLQRMTFTPHPTAGRSAEVVRGYLEGDDPVTHKPILEELISAITKPVTPEEKKVGFIIEPHARTLAPDTPDNLQRQLRDSGATDGLPVVLPTAERVAAMLKGTSHKPDEIVGSMQPSPPYEPWEYTVEQVAINAVMAGAEPAQFPTILALASTGVTTLFSSTSSFARMAVVNGPVRNELNMNSGIGALGPYSPANAVIGRAWTLIAKNLSGSIPGQTYMGAQGNPLNYLNAVVPENEETLPEGWVPLSVQKGFKPDESVISVYTGWSLVNQVGRGARDHNAIKGLIDKLDISGFGGTNSVLYLLDPLVAADLAGTYKTKAAFSEWAGTRSEGQSRGGFPGTGPGGGSRRGATVDIVTVGGGTNPSLYIGDMSYISSASIDRWK